MLSWSSWSSWDPIDRAALRLHARALQWNPWTNVVGIARTLLALGTASTLAFADPHMLFRPVEGVAGAPVCESVARAGVFCVIDDLQVARWVCVLALLVVASGWRPRWTAPVHWWIACSYQANALLVDGGDQVAAVLTFLLLPIALTDDRRWHWSIDARRRPRPHAALIAMSAWFVIRLQMAGIYFHAAVGKLGVEEWIDGTATYYIFSDPMFGAPPWLLALMGPVLHDPVGVVTLTWGTIVLELLLCAALFMRPRWWPTLLVAGLGFHASIAVLHGLVSFMFSMWAGLVCYLRPIDRSFTLPRWLGGR